MPFVHPSRASDVRKTLWAMLALALGSALLPQVPIDLQQWIHAHYLPLHSVIEMVSVIITCAMFAIAWHTPRHQASCNSVLVGCLFLGVGILDFSHMLSYEGMPDFVTPSGPAKAIYFWLAARMLAAAALLAAALLPDKAPVSHHLRAAGLAGVAGLLVAAHAWVLLAPETLPDVFMQGAGPTPFKVAAEYALVGAYLAAALVLARCVGQPRHQGNHCGLAAAALVMAMSEYLFTLYAQVTDAYNLAGHLYKIIAYCFLYRAMFVRSVARTYERLDDSTAELQAMLRALPDLLFEADADGRLLSIHTGQASLLALSPQEFLGKSIGEVLPPEAAQVSMEAIREALRDGISRGHTYQLAVREGCLWFELSVARKPQAEGSKPRLIVIARDITQRVRDARVLEKKAHLGNALLALPDESAGTDSSALIEAALRHAIAMTGSRAGLFALIDEDGRRISHACWTGPGCDGRVCDGMPAGDTEAQDDWILAAQDRQPHILEGDGEPVATPGLHPGLGRIERWLSVPAFDQGRLKMVAGVGNAPLPYTDADVESVRLLADAALRIAQRRLADKQVKQLSTAVAQSPNPVMITDPQAAIEYVNEAFTRVTGYGAAEVLGRNPRILHSGKTPRSTYRDMWESLGRGIAWHGEFINCRKDGTEYYEKALIYPLRDPAGNVTHYLAHKEDVTANKAASARILYLSHFDPLTDLPNRSALEDRLRLALNQPGAAPSPLAVVWLDLDFFKEINEGLGHATGDMVLREMSRRIRGVVSERDCVARMSGDKFALLLADTEQHAAARVATLLLAALSAPLVLEGCELVVTASIGLALYPEDGRTVEELLQCAEVAMYRVKTDSRNGYRFYAPEMQERTARALQLTNALKLAIPRNELRLVYQPQASIATGQLVGAEALLRWRHPQLGDVSPGEFIPLAESSGLIGPIGEWVLRQALQQQRAWLGQGLEVVKVAINLSAVQFVQPDFAQAVAGWLRESGVPGRLIELELTEAAAMSDAKKARQIMDELSALGLALSIDDFGTGYSSLNHLKRFSAYKLKIDQSFVRMLAEDADDQAIVKTIIQMAHSLGMATLAEGVETAAQMRFLADHQCDEVQGYFYSIPLEAGDFAALLRARPPLPDY